MPAYPYSALHIAGLSDGDEGEAEDHADTDAEVRSIGSPQELLALFTELQRQGARLKYLDFHSHGYAGGVSLGRHDLNYDDLRMFRGHGFDALFLPGATISFMSCDLAGVRDGDTSNDGELFLAEFAAIFLRRNGGKAVGRPTPWYYKASLLFRGTWKNSGPEIVAQMTPGATRAVLKGHFRLDENRIKAEIAVLQRLIQESIDSLPGPQSYRTEKLSGPLEQMIVEGARKIRTDTMEHNRAAYSRCMAMLDSQLSKIRGLSSSNSYYMRLHEASQSVDTVLDVLHDLGVPLGQILPPILNVINGMSVTP
jgi:hypothetical protein